MSPVPFFDRTRLDAGVEIELVEVFREVARSGRYILGPEVEAFEAQCAAALGVPHAIGVSSGTDALLVALLSLDVGPGDEVICPAYTFFATAGAIARAGARPVFADILPGTFNLDPGAAAALVTPRTRAIVAVHLFGQCAAMAPILSLAGARGIPVIEDAAQAFGAEHGGRKAGALGKLGCFSFFPTKNLGGFGDGGLVTTSDPALASRARALRAQGAREKHRHDLVGGNFRLDALQAALLRRMLPRLSDRLRRRRENADRYDALLGAAGLPIRLPERSAWGHTFNQYVICVDPPGPRDELRRFLTDRGIGTEVYYPTPLHLQPCFADLEQAEGSLPVAEATARQALALPIFPGLTAAEVAEVAGAIGAFFARRAG
jgi:dTDP-4-amino-4,6-dideoxygalactose transaminase